MLCFLWHRKTPFTWSSLWLCFQVSLLTNDKRGSYRLTRILICANVRHLPLGCYVLLKDQRSSVTTCTDLSNIIKQHPGERGIEKETHLFFRFFFSKKRLPNSLPQYTNRQRKAYTWKIDKSLWNFLINIFYQKVRERWKFVSYIISTEEAYVKVKEQRA